MQYSVSSKLSTVTSIKHIRCFKILLLFLALFTLQTSFAQYDIPDVPDFQTSVYDYINLLSPSEKTSLENKLIKYSDTTSTQIVVAIIATTNGENIGILTPKWAHKWGIGQEKEDNGVFILLAKDDRKIWISPGYGVEHKLTAGTVGEITRNIIIPEFKKENYYLGLNNGADAIFYVLQGEYHGTRQTDGEEFPVILIIFLIFVFIIFIIAISKNRNNGGSSGGRRSPANDILETIILSNMGKGSYRRSSGGFGSWSGGSSGGGFGGGFGGGGFSGGGAGGSW